MTTPNVSTNKSAQTRFNNTETKAEQASMPFNQAAQASLRSKRSGAKSAGGPPVGPAPAQPSMQTPVQQQAPVAPDPIIPQFDPEAAREGIIEDLVANVRREQFINSPQVKDAMTSIRLKNLFNATNPNAMPDNRDLMTRIRARIGM